MSNEERILNRLNEVLHKRGIKNKAVAEAFKCHEVTAGNKLNGKQPITLTEIEGLVEAQNFSQDEKLYIFLG